MTLEYKWKCPEVNPIHESRGPLLTANTKTWVSQGASLEIACTLTVTLGGTVASTEAFIEIANADSLSVALEGPQHVVQPHESLFVYSVVNEMEHSVHRIEWEVEDCSAVFGTMPEECGNVGCSECVLKDVSEHYVKIELSDWNIAGKEFNIVMKVIPIGGTAAIATRKKKIVVDSVPTPGKLIVTPTDGKAWSTTYTLAAENFKNGAKSIYYNFFYRHLSDAAYMPIALKSESNSISTQLPVGFAGDDYSIEMIVRGYNAGGGYTEAKTMIKSSVPYESVNATEQYERAKKSMDKNDLEDVMRNALLGSLMLKFKNDTKPSADSTSLVCNGHGVWIHDQCYCDPFYGTRHDCSIHDTEVLDNQKLAGEILSDIKDKATIEASSEVNNTIVQIIVNIANKPDILTEEIRTMARDLLNATFTEGVSVDHKELAKAIDSVAVLSGNSKGLSEEEYKKEAEHEFNQVYQLVDLLLTKEIKVDPTVKKISYDLQNLNVETYIYSSNKDDQLNNGILEIDSVKSLMGSSKGHMKLTMVEWKTPIYTWTIQYPVVKTNVISVYAKDSEDNEMAVANLAKPIVIKFPLDVEKTSAVELTNIRCMSHNKAEALFRVEEMHVELIDVKNQLGICETYHLTDFAMVIPSEGSILFPNKTQQVVVIEPEEIIKKYVVYRSPLFWFTIAITILFSYLTLWACCKERSEFELVGLMRNKAYSDQKGFFQDKSKIASLVSAPDAFSAQDAPASDRSQPDDNADPNAPAEQNMSSGNSQKDEDEVKVGSLERDSGSGSGSNRDSSMDRETIVRIPDDNREVFEMEAEEIPMPETTAGKRKHKRKIKTKRKGKKKKRLVRVADNPEPSLYKAGSLADSVKTQTDAGASAVGSDTNTLAMAWGRSESSSQLSSGGLCSLLLVRLWESVGCE